MTGEQFIKLHGEGVHEVPLDDDDIDFLISALRRYLDHGVVTRGDVITADELIERLEESRG